MGVSYNALIGIGVEEKKLSLEDTLLNIKGEQFFNDLLRWEKINRAYKSMCAEHKDDKNEAIQAALNEILENKEKIELELQRSNKLLDTSDGI